MIWGLAIMIKRLAIEIICLFLLLSCSGMDKTKFDGVYRSAKAIQGSTSVGVNYIGFGKLLQDFATELSIAEDKATSEKEKELIKSFEEVLRLCQFSYKSWKQKMEYKQVELDEVIQTYWQAAEKELGKATSLYLGK